MNRSSRVIALRRCRRLPCLRCLGRLRAAFQPYVLYFFSWAWHQIKLAQLISERSQHPKTHPFVRAHPHVFTSRALLLRPNSGVRLLVPAWWPQPLLPRFFSCVLRQSSCVAAFVRLFSSRFLPIPSWLYPLSPSLYPWLPLTRLWSVRPALTVQKWIVHGSSHYAWWRFRLTVCDLRRLILLCYHRVAFFTIFVPATAGLWSSVQDLKRWF